MHTTSSTSPTPSTGADPQDRARELMHQELVAVETLLDRGDRPAAAAALNTLLRRSSAEAAGEVLQHAAAVELARDAAWAQPRRRDLRFVPAGRVQVRRGPRRPPTTVADGAAGDAATAAYLAEQPPAEVDPRTGWDVPVWGGLDYDLAALYDLRGAPCLGCRLERTPADRANPDGLCVDCRDTSGLTRERVIERYCELVAATNTAARATELLRLAWKRAGRPTDKQVITAWVAQHRTLLALGDGGAAKTAASG